MTSSDVGGLVLTCFIGVVLVALAVVLLRGKGGFLIAGYNTMPPKEQAKYDEKALCRFVGKILLPVGLLSPAVAVGGILHIGWLPKAYFAVITALALFAVVYANTGGRFRKN